MRSSQLGTDSTMELLQRIVQPTDWFLVWVILSTWIASFLPLHADSVCVMDHAPSSNLHTAVTNQAQLLRQHAKLLLRFVDLGSTCGLIGRALEPFRMMAQAARGGDKISATLQQRRVPLCLDISGHA